MKKVVMLLSNGFNPDVRVQKEAATLIEHGYQVRLISWDRLRERPKQEIIGGLFVERIGLRSAYGRSWENVIKMPVFWTVAFFKLLREDFDVVHCHDFDTLIPGFFAGKIKRKKIVYDSHESYTFAALGRGGIVSKLIELVENFMTKRVDALLVVDFVQEKRYKKISKKCVIVANFPYLTKQSEVDGKKEDLIVYVGGLTTDRGILECVEAVNEARKRRSGIKLLLVGPMPDKALAEKLAALSKSKGYKGVFELTGKVSHEKVWEYLKKAKLGLLLLRPVGQYKTSPYPVKLFEYMGASLPVIANGGCAYADIVKKTGCGVITKDNEARDVADKIVYLLENPEDAERMGRLGAKAVESEYNWRKEGEKLINTYELIGQK